MKSYFTALVCLIATLGCGQQTPKLTETEADVIAQYHTGLVGLARESATADSTLRFYEVAAVPAHVLSGGRLQSVAAATNSYYFFVYAALDTVPHPDLSGVDRVIASFYFNSRSLALGCNGFSTRVKGLFLAHELRHALDCVSGNEVESDTLSDVWLMGEMRAHATVYDILCETTNGRYRQCVSQSQAERESLVVAAGYRPTAFTYDPVPGDSLRLTRFFGPLTEADLSFYFMQLTLDANMLGILKYSPDEITLRRGSLMFLRELYQPHADRNQIDVKRG